LLAQAAETGALRLHRLAQGAAWLRVVGYCAAVQCVQFVVGAVFKQRFLGVTALDQVPDFLLDILFPIAMEARLNGSSLFLIQLDLELLVGCSVQRVPCLPTPVMPLRIKLESLLQLPLGGPISRVFLCVHSGPKVKPTIARRNGLLGLFNLLLEM
jgi:hypothetical protein